MKKYFKGILGALFAGIMVFFVGCGVQEKTFTYYNGTETVSATLTSNFEDITYEMHQANRNIKYALGREKNNTFFMITSESKNLIQNAGYEFDEISEADYANLYITANHLPNNIEINEENNIIYTTYNRTSMGNNFLYYAVFKKGENVFYICQFSCLNKDSEAMLPEFENWSKTITVSSIA